MVVQTTRPSPACPVLSLLVTPDVRTPFKIAASAPMLPATEVAGVRPGDAGRAVARGRRRRPRRRSGQARRSVCGLPGLPGAGAGRGPAVHRRRLREQGQVGREDQADKLASVGTFTEQHVAKDVAGGLRLAGDRGALAFAVMERKDTVLNKTSGAINVSDRSRR